MPFFIQQPPTLDLPRTSIEVGHGGEKQNNRPFNTLEIDKAFVQQVHLKDKFLSLKKAWEKKTMFSSSVLNIVEDSNFKRIVEMGESAVPFIIQEIDAKPSQLVWALNMITGATIRSNHRLTVTEACKAWVKLYNTGKIRF